MKEAKTLAEQLREKFEEAAKKEMLKTTLNAWDDAEKQQINGETMNTTPTHLFKPTNNASRDTFNYVRDNPGKRIAEIKASLTNHNMNTVSTLVYQMTTAGLLRKDAVTKTFHAIKAEFEPFSISKARKERKEAEPKRKSVVVARRTAQEAEAAHNANVAGTSSGLGALTGHVGIGVPATVELTSRPRPWRPEDIVDSLTVVQAIAVHKHLQKLFGAL